MRYGNKNPNERFINLNGKKESRWFVSQEINTMLRRMKESKSVDVLNFNNYEFRGYITALFNSGIIPFDEYSRYSRLGLRIYSNLCSKFFGYGKNQNKRW